MTSSTSQQQLRMMMKQQLASKSDGTNAKDKVKMLKAMKEQQKQQPPPATKSNPSTVNVPSSSSSPFDSGVPAGFFDEAPTAMPAQVTVVANTNLGDKAASKAPPITKNAAVPLGFFDNVEEDFQAHGINYQQFQQKQEEIIQEEVTSFLEDIQEISKEMQEYEEQVELDEKALQEEEEAMLQMSYYTKYAALLKQSEKFVDRNPHTDKASDSNTQELDIDKVLQEAEEIQSIAKVIDVKAGDTESTLSGIDRTTFLAGSLMKQKMANKFASSSALSSKRKELNSIIEGKSAIEKVVEGERMVKRSRMEEEEEPSKPDEDGDEDDGSEEEDDAEDDEDDEEEEYSPLDFMNFTGKY